MPVWSAPGTGVGLQLIKTCLRIEGRFFVNYRSFSTGEKRGLAFFDGGVLVWLLLLVLS